MSNKLMGENYDKVTGAKQFVPVADIRADTISFEQILLQKINHLDTLFSETSETLDRKKIRRIKTDLENFYAWILSIGSDYNRNRLSNALIKLKIKIASLWGSGVDPDRQNRWEIFLAMKDYFSVLKTYAISYGRILPHEKNVLLVGHGVYDREFLYKNIEKLKPIRPQKAFGEGKNVKKNATPLGK